MGGGAFDLVTDFGAQMSMPVIGMLLGIPESDHEAVRHQEWPTTFWRQQTTSHVAC